MGIGANIIDGFNESRETIRNINVDPTQLKNEALDIVHGAINTIKGSGSPVTDIKKTAQAYPDMVTSTVSGGANACLKLVSGHPIEAIEEGAKGISGSLKAMAIIGVAPAALTISTIRSGLKMGKNTAAAAINTPFKVYRTTMNGADQLLNLLGPTTGSAPSNDNNTPAVAAAPAGDSTAKVA